MLKEIIIRRYKKEDQKQVIDLLNRNFKKQEHINMKRDISWWEWKYEKNVYGMSQIYIAEYKGEIIGVRPMWAWKVQKQNKILHCLQPIDTVVDIEYRGLGVFTKLSEKAIEENKDNYDIIFNFPNKQSLKGNLNLGWNFLCELQWFVKINNFKSVFSLLNNNTGFNSIDLEKEDSIDAKKIKEMIIPSAKTHKFTTIKTEEYLTWRFLEHPKINYGFNFIKLNDLVLYYIFEINENPYGRELIVIDYFGDYELFNEMVTHLNRIAKKYQVTYTLIIKKNTLPRKLGITRFLKNSLITQKRKNFVVLPLNEEYKSELLSYNKWEICMGMHDSV